MKFSRPANGALIWSERSETFIGPMLRDSTIIFLAALVASYTCVERAFSQGLRPDDSQSTVHGTVVNAVTREPIARALVSSTNNRFAVLTDSDGHFGFPLPKANTNGATGIVFSGQP